MPVGDVTIEDVGHVHIATRALDSFRFHHGGGIREAEVQLRSMLEDFLIRSARHPARNDYLLLARDGFELVLSPDRAVVTGYSTSHRERTWAQVKAGVQSRFGHRGRGASGEPPEPGPAVDRESLLGVLDPSTVYLTARVRASYSKVALLADASDVDLDDAIRAAVAGWAGAVVAVRSDGLFEVTADGLLWLVSPDGLGLIGVKRIPVGDGPA